MDVNGSVGVGVNECQRVEHRAQKVRGRNLREETGTKKEQSGYQFFIFIFQGTRRSQEVPARDNGMNAYEGCYCPAAYFSVSPVMYSVNKCLGIGQGPIKNSLVL